MSGGIDSAAMALDEDRRRWTFAEIDRETDLLAQRLRSQGSRVIATLRDNAPVWVVADRAALHAGLGHVPLPAFFTPEQVTHALGAAGVDTVLTLPALAARWPQVPATEITVAAQPLTMLHLPARAVPVLAATTKVTFTSGTTGSPKGVCLAEAAMTA